MTNATFHIGRNSLRLPHIFDFERDRLASPGSPWFSPATPPPALGIRVPTQHPETFNFGEREFGMRFDRSAGALTFGLIDAYASDKPRSLASSIRRPAAPTHC